jgi:hypothetical protein
MLDSVLSEISGIIAFALVVLIVLGLWLVRRGGGGIHIAGPTLVLRKFKIDDAPSAEVVVDIVGRVSGIIAWLLTIIGFDAEYNLKVTDKEITFKSSSLYGQIHRIVPLPSVASTHCGYSKPIGYLIMGAIFLVGSVLSGLEIRSGGGLIVIGLVIGVIFLIAYYLSKKIAISLETSGGMQFGLSFKRSVMETVSVDMDQALRAIRIINQKIIESQMRMSSAQSTAVSSKSAEIQSEKKDVFYDALFEAPTVQDTKYYDIIKIGQNYCMIKVSNSNDFKMDKTFEIVRGNALNYIPVGKGKVAKIKDEYIAFIILNGIIQVNDKIKYEK